MDETLQVGDFINTYILGTPFYVSLTALVILSLFSSAVTSRLSYLRRVGKWEKVFTFFVVAIFLYVIGCRSIATQPIYTGAWFALPVFSTLASLVIVTKALLSKTRANRELTEQVQTETNLVLLGKIMLFVWSAGWVLFFVTIGISMLPHVGSELLLRSAIASFNMFMLDVDTNIIDDISSHDVLKGVIACTSFLASMCTALLVISLILTRLLTYLHMKHLMLNANRNHLYVFFGFDDASRALAKDILRPGNDENGVVLFVENSVASEKDEEDSIFGSIFSMLTHKKRTFDELRSVELPHDRTALIVASQDISSVDEAWGANPALMDVFGAAGVESLKKKIQSLDKIAGGELHIMFLGDNRERNLQSVINVLNDTTLGAVSLPVTIYCQTRYDGISRVVEDAAHKSNINVRVIDSSRLSVEALKHDVQHHPVQFVEINEDGKVEKPLTSLLVGFGRTGEDAARFLYEFGTFLGTASTETEAVRSPFACHAVDIEMQHLEGRFCASIPAVNCTTTANENPENASFYLYDYDPHSLEFFNLLTKLSSSLNYVVVATGDDERNMDIAISILRYVRRYRNDLNRFAIYVRTHEKGAYYHMKEIERHYNQRLGNNVIRVFGYDEDIYTYNLIVRDEYAEQGKRFYEGYRALQKPSANDDEGTWEQRRGKLLGTIQKLEDEHWQAITDSEGHAQFKELSPRKLPTWNDLNKLRRKETQDRSNALHARTKLEIIKKVLKTGDVKDFAKRVLNGKRQGLKTDIHYEGLSAEDNRVMLHMAMLEHLRWNAAHEMMGYVDNISGHSCDETRKRHNCLKTWAALDAESDAVSYIEDYKVFDFGVVETTLKLYLENEQ